MAIYISTQADIGGEGINNALNQFAERVGINGLSDFPTNTNTPDIQRLRDVAGSILNTLRGKSPTQKFDPNFVGTGRQLVVGGNIQGGKVPPLEEGNVRQIFSQTPNISVVIKKRAFSSLQNLYDPKYMDPAEQWLLRAIKRLVARKCAIMADYERLTKIKSAAEAGFSTGAIVASLFASAAEKIGIINDFTPAVTLERTMQMRQPVKITTYFTDENLPILEKLGPGNGVFEITTISQVNTSLDLDGNGSASFTLEDPYHILFVTEEDIEAAIRDTALSALTNSLSSAASSSLGAAQSREQQFNAARRAKNQSPISFTVNIGGANPVNATVDAIGFSISPDNLEDIPEAHSLDAADQAIFNSIFELLEVYSQAVNKTIISGLNVNSTKVGEEISYVREKMRKFHLGKHIIQPMDTVHVYIDSGTRKSGEGTDITNNLSADPTSVSGALSLAGNILGLQDEAQLDDDLLKVEWENEAKSFMSFSDFKKLRSLQTSGEGAGFHVFAGLVDDIGDRYDANSGKYTLSVKASSNMKWLQLSRYNSQPSLDQTQGIVYDPLTPFKISTDPATGLPLGAPELLEANRERIGGNICKLYFNNGPAQGAPIFSIEDLKQDKQQVGGNLIELYQHAPGLLYRWKEGIMTATYDMQTTDPLNRERTDSRHLRRDVGFFASQTPFDNMDAANIISIMVTGFPYNFSTFVQATSNTGAFTKDTTTNSRSDYFHTFFEIQRSLNFVHGSFVPFKPLNTNPVDLANAVRLQRQLSNQSSQLRQLRAQKARVEDRLGVLNESDKDADVVRALSIPIQELEQQITDAENSFSELVKTGADQKENIIRIAGDDITFELENIEDENQVRFFGDRLIHATLRRREEVVYNRDKNYLIISDDYDKDFDIQAFVLNLRRQSPEMFKSSWQSTYQLCKTVANTLDFEFFVNSQGHIEFRPPQYNRTPVSVLEAMFRLSKTTGIKVFPEFLEKLFETRQQNLTKDIEILEWEIRLKAALLGATDDGKVWELTGIFFLSRENDAVRSAAKARAKDPREEFELTQKVKQADALSKLTNFHKEGLFSASTQTNLTGRLPTSNRDFYNRARKKLINLTGNSRAYPEFNEAEIGVVRNGQSTPATDLSNVISKIAGLVSRRSQLLRTLEGVLDQKKEIGQVGNNGNLSLSNLALNNLRDFSKGVWAKLVFDDTKNTLGHLSGERFIIRDEVVLSSQFREAPPEMTNVVVDGTDPLVGEKNQGNLAGYPLYKAYGVDFDLWRQYGWRSEKVFDKPYFWSAELQCAPYAVMILSRQRANIVTGEITVIGNEFYQLGDVVYVVDRQMLYYVHSISHSIGYDGRYETRLTLKYGHAPGDYIPTPTDVIGKGVVSRSQAQAGYRLRRERSRNDSILGVIKFEDDSDPLAGVHGQRNFNILKNSALAVIRDLNPNDATNSPRLYIMGFGDDAGLESKISSIFNWFLNPSRPGESNLEGVVQSVPVLGEADNNLGKYKISNKLIATQIIRQCLSSEEQTNEERENIRKGIVADEQSYLFDETLNSTVEIRLRLPPPGGWPA